MFGAGGGGIPMGMHGVPVGAQESGQPNSQVTIELIFDNGAVIISIVGSTKSHQS